MKPSKRTQRALKTLEKIKEHLEYYTNDVDYLKDFELLEELILELSLEKKEDHARFAKKLKKLYELSEKV